MNAVNWTAAKDAIHAWIVSTTGLDATRVLFGGPNPVRPPGVTDAWISIWIMGDEQAGGSPFITYFDNPTPTPGAEIIKQATSDKLVTMEVRCFAAQNTTDATEAYVYLSDLVSSADLTENTETLSDAGVSLDDFSSVTTTGQGFNTSRIEPCALLVITFMTPSIVQRPMTYIETVNIQLEVSDGVTVKDFDFALDLDSSPDDE